MRNVLADLRYACRIFVRHPVFTVAATSTMAVAVAANTAIFSLVYSILLAPLPIPGAAGILRIEERHTRGRLNLTGATFSDLRDRSRALQAIAAYRLMSPGISTGGAPEQVTAAEVSPDYFRLLGVQPLAGRWFEDADFAPSRPDAVILSHAVWQRVLGGDPAAVGRRIRVNAEPADVIAIMPRDFYAPGAPEIWRPRSSSSTLLRNRRAHLFTVIGRLSDGATLEQARDELDAAGRDITRASAAVDSDLSLIASPLQARMVEGVRTGILMLWGTVALVLLIGAANVANLLLMQGTSRARELSIRTALGAARGRLIRQLATESLVLGAAGGTAGTLLGLWSIPVLRATLPASMPRADTLAANVPALICGVVASLAITALFGLAPAMRLSSRQPIDALRHRSAGERSHSRLRAALVIAEVSLTVMLLFGAGLLGRSLASLLRIDPGFDPAGVLTLTLSLPPATYADTSAVDGFYTRVLAGIKQLPGVIDTGATGALPLTGTPATTMVPEGGERRDQLSADVVTSTPGFFRALGIPLTRGRLFTTNDKAGSVPVVVINESAARRFWPDGSNPVGRNITMRDWGNPYRAGVVGVVGDIHQAGLDVEPAPAAYYPLAQFPETTLTQSIVVRTAGDARTIAGAARDQIWSVDRDQPIASIRPMDAILASGLAQRRVNLLLLATFAATALLLAAIGIYGVVAYGVGQRTREIGVRIALGARPEDVARLVLSHGVAPVAVGLAIGLCAALACAELIRGLLFRIAPTDGVTLAGVALLIMGIAALACAGPTWRAVRMDPISVLRSE
jgi:putative ABC transport system permease protein